MAYFPPHLTRQQPMILLRNMFRSSPSERSWEPMPLTTTSDEAAPTIGDVVSSTARSNNSDEYIVDSARGDCLRRRGYMCVDTAVDDLDDPVSPKSQAEGVDDVPLEPLSESIYGFAIASLIQDSVDIHEHPAYFFTSLRPLRILAAFLLCGLTFCMQFLLMVETKRLVTPTEVKHVRGVYGTYEHIMYQDENLTSHTKDTINGYDRGVAGYFNASNWDRLSTHDKELVCRIPLSQPLFCFMVLFIWTLTVLAHMRDILNTSLRICAVREVGHERMREVTSGLAEGDVMVQGLTLCMKYSIVLFVQLPRIAMCLILLWLGARWLVATVGFGDLLLNAVALEFILNLAELFYNVLVPYSGKVLVRKTYLPHLHRHEHETCANMFGMLACGLFACILVWLYMYYVQVVLPSYRWDVRKICTEYLDKNLGPIFHI